MRLKEWKLNDAALSALEIGAGPDAKAALEKKGISFPPGATATWIPSSKRLIIKNTGENLDQFDFELFKLIQTPREK